MPPSDTIPDDDPFTEFNRAMGAGLVENPYPEFAEMRRVAPITPADVRQLMGLAPDSPMPDVEMPPIYTVSSYEALCAVLRDGKTFSSSGYAEVMGPVMGHTILEMDEPEHHTYRALIQQAFTRKAMERWEADLVAPIVHEMVDGFVDDGRADLVNQLTFPFPVTVIAAMLGLPRDDLDDFHRWAVELIGVHLNPERGMAASVKLRDYFAGILAERRRRPATDVISVLAEAEHDGVRLTDEEIFSFLRLLLPAGAETTYRSSSNLLFGLLTHPGQLDDLRRDRSLMAAAIEEGLRWEPPLLTIMRTASRDAEVCGVPIPRGAVLVINLGSGNHDEARWDDAESFDIHRKAHPNLAFAFGPHTCLGLHLARMETRVALDAVLDRLPDVRIDPSAEAPYITGMTFRAPPTLPVVWE